MWAARHKAMRPPTGAKHPQQWGHGHASSQLVCALACETAPYGYKFRWEPPPKAQGSPSASPSHLWWLSTAYGEPATINPGRVFLGWACCRQSPYSGCLLTGVYTQCHPCCMYKSSVAPDVCPPCSRTHSLQGEGEVVLAGLAVAHQVARLLAEPQQRLGVRPADGPVVPAAGRSGTSCVHTLGTTEPRAAAMPAAVLGVKDAGGNAGAGGQRAAGLRVRQPGGRGGHKGTAGLRGGQKGQPAGGKNVVPG